MSYMDIDNLYKSRDILLFKECYAMEKIHGTSAHIRWADGKVHFFSGGSNHENFVKLFDESILTEKFKEIGQDTVIVYGEAYGGKIQKMRETYGDEMKFIVFEVKIGDCWLSVSQAEQVAMQLGLEFVWYRKIFTDLDAIDVEKDAESVQAFRNGCGTGKMREGIVLRPLIEVKKNNGERIIAKHKRDDFRETETKRSLKKDKFEVLQKAEAIAEEWATEMRLTHVLDAFPNADITQTGDIIKAMIDDIDKESENEIIKTKASDRAIAKKTALMFKQRLKR